MKKIFTLLAALFICNMAVFAQDEEEPVAQELTSFWCHEFRDTSVGAPQFDGPAMIVEDPTNPSNHCARVIVRSQDEAIAAENMIEADGHIAGWDSQFFIYSKTALEEGKEIKLQMRVRADKPCSVGTQAHNNPGDYNHWQCVGNVEFTTEWKKIELTATVSADMTQSANGKEFHSIALNLADFREGNVVYFDDVKLFVRDPKQTGPGEFSGWFNLLRKGNETDDLFNGGAFHTFTGRDGEPGVDQPARTVIDTDGKPAYQVTSVGFNATKEVEIIDPETGLPFLDDDGNPETEIKQIWIKSDGTEVENIDNWQTQFFVTVPHKFVTGQKYKLVMSARADKPCSVETQAHRMPGDYKHWDMVGTLNLTPEWTDFVFGDPDYGDERTISADQNECQTIAFNCNVLKEENNLYFRFKEFSFNDADVTVEERTLGKEDITVAVPAPGEEPAATAVDFTNCMAVLEAENIDDLLNYGNMTVQRKPVKLSEEDEAASGEGWKNYIPDSSMETEDPSAEDPQGEEEDMEVQYEPELAATSGFSFNTKGLYDENGTLDFEVPEGFSTENVTFNVYNNGDEFEGTGDGVFFFVQDGWNYRFNVTFKGEDATGISEVAAPASQKTVKIFDLSGRRVMKPTKGLYIMDGKKVLVK